MSSPAVTRPTITRDQQLAQLHRRYGSGPIIALKPSDPDFVYPLPSLQFHLHVPDAYPSERPSIRVLNGELPAWAKKNVEQGFKAIAERGRERWEKTTLLDLLRVLDRELEDLLSAGGADESRVETQSTSTSGSRSATPIDGGGSGSSIKIVRPSQGRVSAIRTPAPPAVARTPSPSAEPPTARSPTPPTSAPVRAPTPPRAYTPSELSGAASKRAQDIRQLMSRLKLSPLFSGSPEGTHFTVPIESPKKYLLPVPLQPLNSARLIVPKNYNLEPPRIEILGAPGDLAKRIEKKFAEHVTRNSELSLTAAVNVLAAKLHLWAVAEEPIAPKIEKISTPKEEETAQQSVNKSQEHSQEIDPGKAHIKVIPRPPEWGLPNDDDDDDEDSSGSDLDNTDQDEDGHQNHATEDVSSSGPPDGDHHSTISERGTSLSCPGIQLTGIDLLAVSSLNLTIKCLKCKTEQDILNLRGTQPNERAMPRAVRCQKCSDVLGIGFRKEFVHQGSQRLGFFDLMNCSIAELRPIDLIPQCEECSSEEIRQELKGVMRGQVVFTNCRTCFKRMSVLIPEFKLLNIGGNTSYQLKKVPNKSTDKERYVAGTELPMKGKCKHYRKSTRWFRFSCCNNVYPCDKCHDASESHPSEHANRMICGLCSREQNYRPEDCRFCGNMFMKKSMSRYWEGGKGTRDKRLMSRNDPRKYKRVSKPLV